MSKKTVAARHHTICCERRLQAVAVLPRKDRKLWAGAATREDAMLRMREDSADCYPTHWDDLVSDEPWAPDDAASE
jgi:hypothetical protein